MRELNELPKEFEKLKNRPKNLFYKGDISLLNRAKISIVGTRRPNQYTKARTEELSKKLANIGYVIVSGAAMGVDAIAHKGAFPNTIAVMANSLDIIYPAVNRALIEDIYSNALAISEYGSATKATKYSFVHRNRLVVALGEVLIITQADLKSGSLRSFEYAKQMGKEVFVLSHRVGESLGTQKLIKDAEAKVIVDIDEFVSQFGTIEKCEDEFSFLDTPKPLKEALSIYGEELYMMELEGKVVIENLMVRKA
ncbi:MAG: DNA-processing protein DprA [Sulfurospirillum sp.]|nr:MAG: DNA-processing protein DprA [Sulfurospirillum sp.]